MTKTIFNLRLIYFLPGYLWCLTMMKKAPDTSVVFNHFASDAG